MSGRKGIVGQALSHGHRRGCRSTPEYRAWTEIKARCSSPNHPLYEAHRGVRVVWQSFESFLRDVGSRPGPEFSLQRNDDKADYEAGTVEWRIRPSQIEFDGLTQSMREWARLFGIPFDTLRKRLDRGWPIKDALLTRVSWRRRSA